jgi:hypothetical protein
MTPIPMHYQQSEAKRRLAGRIHSIRAMLKASTDELIQAAHDELVLRDAGCVDDIGDPINRIAAEISGHADNARHEIDSCLRTLELWLPRPESR